jgi:probable addiction module antidote protein
VAQRDLRDGRAQARIDRLEIGNPGDVRPVGSGISEMRIDYTAPTTVSISSRVAPQSSFCSRAATRARRSAISGGARARPQSVGGGHGQKKTNKKTNTKTKTIPWDSAAYLKTDRDIAHYLEAVFEDGDPALISHALGVIARAKGMAQIAKAAGLGRESLYKALSGEGNPEFATVLKVMRALGLRLTVSA